MFGNRVVIDPSASAAVRMVAEDLTQLLTKATGQKFSIGTATDSRPAIMLTRTAPSDLPASERAKLDAATTESFYLRANARQVLIYAKSNNGLSNGAYFWLEQLGFHWFMPGENWEIVPRLTSLQTNFERTVVPDFRLRKFFGTGGFVENEVLEGNQDAEESREEQWLAWHRRARWGQEFKVGGHAGANFNKRHRAELEKNTTWLALVDGKRGPWAENAKLCASNPEALAFFAKDRIAAYENAVTEAGGEPVFSISVEPSDGARHCECAKCKAIGGASEQTFHIANQIAIALRKKHPGAWVNLYAYNDHAEVPNLTLEPNVYVTVAPYSYQKVSSPEVLIEKWGKKTSRLAVRDYWNLTDWGKEQPDFDFLRMMPERVRFWKKNRIEGALVETTYGKGPMGVSLYLASRLFWDANADVPALLREFYQTSFGPAAAPMQRLLERWSAGYKGRGELPFALLDLDEATRLAAGNEAVLRRIDEYKAYVHYLRLFAEYQHLTPNEAPARATAVEGIARYIWSMNDMLMLHTSRIHSIIVGRMEKKTNPQLREKWRFKKGTSKPENWGIVPLTKAQLDKNFADDLRAYPKIFDLPASDRSANRPPGDDGLENMKPGKVHPQGKETQIRLNRTHTIFVQTGASGKVGFAANFGDDPRGKGQTPFVTVYDASHKVVGQQALSNKGQWQNLNFDLSPNTEYELQIKANGCPTDLKLTDAQAWQFGDKLQLSKLPERLHIFVPAGTAEIFVEIKPKTKFKLFDANGAELTGKEAQPGTLRFAVPSGMAGKWWSFGTNKGEGFNFMNIPNRYALFPNLQF